MLPSTVEARQESPYRVADIPPYEWMPGFTGIARSGSATRYYDGAIK